jgi:hypothetical protein
VAIYHRLNGEQVEILAAVPENKIKVRYPDGVEGQTNVRWLVADDGMREIQRAIMAVDGAGQNG